MQPRDLGPELSPIPGTGQGQLTDVELDVKVGVVDPVGPIEVEWRTYQLAPQGQCPRKASLHLLDDLIERRLAVWRGRRIVNARHAEMVGCTRCLGRQKGRVNHAELAHAASLVRSEGLPGECQSTSFGHRTQSPNRCSVTTRSRVYAYDGLRRRRPVRSVQGAARPRISGSTRSEPARWDDRDEA